MGEETPPVECMNKDRKRPVQGAQVVLAESPPYVGSPVSPLAKAVRNPPPPAYLAEVHKLRGREHTISMAHEIALEEHMNKYKERSDRHVKVAQSKSPPGAGLPSATSTRRRARNPLLDPLPDHWSPRNVAIVEAVRKDLLLMQGKVDYSVEVFNTLRSLDTLHETFLKRGDLKGALCVMRERIKLLSPGEHVKPVTEWERQPREVDPYEEAFRELDPVDREAVRKRMTAFDEEKEKWTYERTGRNPGGSMRVPNLDSSNPDTTQAGGSANPATPTPGISHPQTTLSMVGASSAQQEES